MPRAGTTTARGYGTRHQQERRRWEPTVRAGLAICARCHQPIPADAQWDLGHTDDRTAYLGPEHQRCNRTAGARNAANTTNLKRRTTRRDW